VEGRDLSFADPVFYFVVIMNGGIMKKFMALVLSLSVLVLSLVSDAAERTQPSPQPPVINGVTWIKGPEVGKLGSMAELRIPKDYVFAGSNDTRIILEKTQNPTNGKELGFVAPNDLQWFVIFEFDDVGYVPDTEKGSLDADAMLETIKKGTEESNKERQRRGWAPMTVLGWEQKPRYNELTHNLEWAIRGESEGHKIINYNTRLLGRKGVMRVALVTEPEFLTPTMPKFQNILAGFGFSKGQKYSEFIQGDKVAQYGLSALVVGGAAAAAAKSGVFKWLWKVLVVAFIAVAAFLRRLFSRKKAQQDGM
jgi:uncharacterized membrane-anchored protein